MFIPTRTLEESTISSILSTADYADTSGNPTASKVFSPSPDEAEYAGRVVRAFGEAQAKGLGAISFEGKMIDYMNYKQARHLVSFVGLISEKEEKRRRASSISLSQFFASTPHKSPKK